MELFWQLCVVDDGLGVEELQFEVVVEWGFGLSVDIDEETVGDPVEKEVQKAETVAEVDILKGIKTDLAQKLSQMHIA